ncbi:MAG TPA: metalloregulator ArsR/SmtB family transcription factor [Polyangiaceae bacterium]|nr:metalloregulator ArsR/SmtB family transcription factor [Polyangiaceae bacterium]HMR76785.1 metalloregulator ArsR/SmtB family transcription factor [Polyangiaceae bacterium]
MLEYYQEVDGIFRALADPTRRAILEHLDQGPASVSALAAPFDLSLAAVAQHVQVLERSHLVTTRKQGRQRLCAVDPTAVKSAEQWLRARRSRWERRLDRLEHHLDKIAKEPG